MSQSQFLHLGGKSVAFAFGLALAAVVITCSVNFWSRKKNRTNTGRSALKVSNEDGDYGDDHASALRVAHFVGNRIP